MAKRNAMNQMTRENEGRDESDEDPVEEASATVMATRKIAKPRSRRNLGTPSTSSAPSSNPFGSIGSAPAPANPFGSIGLKPNVQLVNPSQATPLPKQSQPSEKSNQKALQQRALNEKFATVIADMVKSNVGGDWTETVNKYISYVKSINSGTISTPAPDTTTSAISSGTTSAAATSSAPSKTGGFSFGSTTSATAGSTASTTTTNSGFSFGSTSSTTTAPPAKSFMSGKSLFGSGESTEQAPKQKEQPKFTFGTQNTDKKDESEDESDDEKIEIKGPSFKLNEVPTMKDSPFTFNKQKSQEDEKKTGFVFTSTKPSSDSVFKFNTNTNSGKKDNEEGQSEKKTPAFSFGSSAQQEKPSAPAATPSAPSAPAFTVGSSSTTNATESTPQKPTFTFGSSGNSNSPNIWTPDKGIKFGGDATGSASAGNGGATAAPPAAGSGLFGSKPAASGGLFGAKPATSGGLFGSNSATGGSGGAFSSSSGGAFSFNPAPLPSQQQQQDKAAQAAQDQSGDGDDKEQSSTPAEPSNDLSEKGPGEENETVAYEQKAKLFKFADGNFAVQGLGQLRILTHNETNKTRALLRAEGSGRVILNILIRKEIDYKIEGKNQVRLVDFDAETKKPITYLVRVKTGDDAKKLQGVLEAEKVK